MSNAQLSITKLTVEQLRKELAKYDLDTKGRKGELLARLVDHLEGDNGKSHMSTLPGKRETLTKYWASFTDGGPALYDHYFNISCLAGLCRSL